ncbi:HlyD family efflux transporter periplasmic adaptor subunit [Stieleria sp. TO1_6]|uniref:efflux RND transporter periplasmic adaptor subunit n=1 Tax=Stieleria tagensis TaxID=2956795 RepID=UPI00209B7E99|nr:HlyD family efflux transporter periplasmic adaptor subunit [Stieleria tagensis]MCO8123875.1 HlyD family efflux transporter periplasmic adaptor subunit [Stieleria tagensis]
MFKQNAFLIGSCVGLLLALAVEVAPAVAQTGASPSLSTLPSTTSNQDGVLVEGCMVRYINKTQVPSESQGKLTELKVEEGMTIKKGDVIAVVDAKQARLALRMKKAEELVAKLNAQNDVNKRDAIASEEIAAAEAKTYDELYEKGAAPYWEMRKKQAEADRAKLRITLAELNEDTAMAEYLGKQIGSELAETDIEMRTIRADFDAFVEKRVAQLGEWVQPGSPIVELVQMDEVRVEGFIDALNYAGQVSRGAPVEVLVTVGGSSTRPVTKRFNGVIDYVSTELDLKQRHRIWVRVVNERVGDGWLIMPGMAATLQISPSTP